MRSHRSLALLLLLAAAGCGPLLGRSYSPAPGPDQDRMEDRPVLARKEVASKEAPGTLVATDGTRCIVNGSRFEKTEPGDRVWCTWLTGAGVGVGRGS